MTISPPAKVKVADDDAPRVLSSGVDTLELSFYVTWRSGGFLDKLKGWKRKAMASEKVEPGWMQNADDTDRWEFNVLPYGAKGYEWLLQGREYTLKVGGWREPRQRPSVYAEIRSETLWRGGVEKAVERLMGFLRCAGAEIHVAKVSRADLCVDVLLAEGEWSDDLRPRLVTRARQIDPHYFDDTLTGISIGRGAVSARLYDKPLEILQKSHKDWMYNVWGLEAVPEGNRIIRVEFQLRREPLKELKVDTFKDLMAKLGEVWAYCTEKWLKVEDRPGKHHTQRHTVPWWVTVQHGWGGAQGACAAVRQKAIKADLNRAGIQLVGAFTSYVAVCAQHVELGKEGEDIRLDDWLPVVKDAMRAMGVTDGQLTRRVHRKLAKFKRGASFCWRDPEDEDILLGNSEEAKP